MRLAFDSGWPVPSAVSRDADSVRRGRGPTTTTAAAAAAAGGRHYDSPLITSLTGHIKTKQTVATGAGAGGRHPSSNPCH